LAGASSRACGWKSHLWNQLPRSKAATAGLSVTCQRSECQWDSILGCNGPASQGPPGRIFLERWNSGAGDGKAGETGGKVSAIRDTQTKDDWHLRAADLNDIDGLHGLAASPLVYRYLFDGTPPDKEYITRLVAQSVVNARESRLGMWFLEDVSTRYAGCVELRPHPSSGCVELTYLLDPRNWGQGLALRMAWTAITHTFLSSQIDSVIAGADLDNAASLALMLRLGMHFRKDVQYPLGAGVEYVLHRNDLGPLPKPALISLSLTACKSPSGRRIHPS
jgi:[ribosomal protein S5]-alanine N-acetyltransferase